MKTRFILLFFMIMVIHLQAHDPRYIDMMTKNIALVYQAQTLDELQGSVNTLQRIGTAEKNQWEPYYYAAFGYIMMANREQVNDKKDNYLDLAEASLEQAGKIKESESEIAALDGFIKMIRVTVDPASRGARISGLAYQSYKKALSLNPENPRALGLMAQMQYGTAQFFKSSTEDACATARMALEKFDNWKSDNLLAPRWGREMTEQLLVNCQDRKIDK